MACTKKGKPAAKTDKKGSTKGKKCQSSETKSVDVKAHDKCVKGKKVSNKAQTRNQKVCKKYG